MCQGLIMKVHRHRPRFVGWNSIGLSAVLTIASIFLLVNSLVLNTGRPSHDHWWFWPLIAVTAALALYGATSVVWLLKHRS